MMEPICAGLERGEKLNIQIRRERIRLVGSGRDAPARAIRARQRPCSAGRDLVQLEVDRGLALQRRQPPLLVVSEAMEHDDDD
jgi:hypothetical protein